MKCLTQSLGGFLVTCVVASLLRGFVVLFC